MKSSRIFILTFLLLLPVFSHGQVYVNEIMYDSPGADDDWVEIYNSGSAPVTIVTGSASGSWRFVDSGSHILTLTTGGATLAPGAYAVITNDTAKFNSDWTGFSGTLFKSSFSLTNTSNTVYLKDASGTVTDPAVSYVSTQGAKGDGNSLQRQPNGTWISASPTPGIVNVSISSSTSTTTDEVATTTEETTNDTASSSSQTSSSVTSAHSSPAPLSLTEPTIEFEISAGRDRLTTVGNSLIFRVVTTKSQNISEQGITYKWSFGDGTTGQGNTVNHSYKFAGDYFVVVNANYSDQQAVARLVVGVTSPNISINKVSGGTEISNNSKTEINLEGWNLISHPSTRAELGTGQEKTFVFPTDTLMPGGNKIIFPDDVTGMSDETIQLLNPIGKEIGFIKKVDAEMPQPIVTNKTDINLDDIQVKIEEVKNEVAQITGRPSAERPVPDIARTLQTSPDFRASLGDSVINITTTSVLGSSTPVNIGIGTTNTATVFEATKQKGFVSAIFSWPIRGFNFVRRLFIEE